MEILIALGDEAACLVVVKRLLKMSPSHPRALQIQQAIEQNIDLTKKITPPHTISPRGIDLLQPKYFSLSFANKRKLETVYESEQQQKKRKLYSMEIKLPEASWFALVNAVTDVLKGGKFWKDSESSLNSEIVVSPGGNQTDKQKAPPSVVASEIVNATIKFTIHKSSPLAINQSSGQKDKERIEETECRHENPENVPAVQIMHEEVIREGSATIPAVTDSTSKPVVESHIEGGDGESALAQPRQSVCGEKAESLKPLDLPYDWDQPSQERRSTRLEKLRSCRRLDKEEDSLGQSKDPAKALKKKLEPFVICPPAIRKFETASESTIKEEPYTTGTPSVGGPSVQRPGDGANMKSWKGDGGNFITEDEEKAVLQFVKGNETNSGIYHVAQQLLEQVVAMGPSQRKSLSWLLFLEKLTRMWASDRSSGCSLFLAEVYMDMASSAANDTTASTCFNDCNYNVCCLVESATLQTSCASSPQPWKWLEGSKASGVGIKEGSRTPAMTLNLNGKYSEEPSLGEVDTGSISTGRLLKDNMSSVELQDNWPFWTRFHWLSGRLWIRSGQWEQAYRELARCQSILEGQEREGSSAIVFLPHCKLDKEISLERVSAKLYELQVENLLKHSAAKMLERGQYVDLIELLKPVLLSGKQRSSDKLVDDLKRGDAAVSSHEMKGLDMLVTACEKIKPPNLVLALQCRELRLKLLCQAAGFIEVQVGESDASSPEDRTFTSMDSELDATQLSPDGLWSKLVVDEVLHITVCAALLKEKPEELEGSVALPPVLRRVQVLLLTLMCHFIKMLTHRGQTAPTNPSLNTQFYSSCFVDSAIAFCSIQHLHPAVPIEHQVCLCFSFEFCRNLYYSISIGIS